VSHGRDWHVIEAPDGDEHGALEAEPELQQLTE